METAQIIFTWLSVLMGLVSAYLWYRASVVVVCDDDTNAVPGFSLGMRHPWSIKLGKSINVMGTMAEGSRLNKLAAIATAIVVALQALATGAGVLAEQTKSQGQASSNAPLKSDINR